MNENKYELVESICLADFISYISGPIKIIKMDIEGAEFDVVPCLSQSPAAVLVDFL